MQTDREAIDDLLTRYATAVDRRDWQLFRSCFTTDAQIDYTSAGGIKGSLEEVVTWLAQVLPVFTMTQHLVVNRDIAIEGDRATARSAFFNPLGVSDGKGGMTLFFDGGYYSDKLVRTGDGWRIVERVEETAYTTRLHRLGG
ncbi:MAG TPA: nuclear transport factor 2 family protein [Terriglobales bacterium]|nr:nuclear transport factor 2 family protein [Terriglobales bacterium]